MTARPPLQLHRSESEPPALSDRAIDNLQFIRDTMERAGSFTAISGRGISAVGATGLIAAAVCGNTLDSPRWLVTWFVAAAVAFVTSVAMTLRKMRTQPTPVAASAARKLALAFFPALVAGAVMTAVTLYAGSYFALPGLWMLTYGAAVMAGGALSIPLVPVMGALFMLVGAAALGAPLVLAEWSSAAKADLLNVLLAASFGILHLIFGVAISRRYGG